MLPESKLSQLTWTGDGDPAGSTDRTTPLGARGANGSLQSRPMAVRSNVHVPSARRTPSAEPRPQSAVGRSRQAAFWAGPQGTVAGQAVTLAVSAPVLAPAAGDSLSRSVSPSRVAPSATATPIPTAATL